MHIPLDLHQYMPGKYEGILTTKPMPVLEEPAPSSQASLRAANSSPHWGSAYAGINTNLSMPNAAGPTNPAYTWDAADMGYSSPTTHANTASSSLMPQITTDLWAYPPAEDPAGTIADAHFAADAQARWALEGPSMRKLARAHAWAELKTLAQSLGLDGTDHQGRTLLHEAAYLNDSSLAQWLLDQGANPAIRDTQGQTPLEEALHYDHWAVAVVLSQAPNTRRVQLAQY